MMPTVGEKPPADSNTRGMLSSRSPRLSSSSCMMARSSLGSVPSTANIRDFFRKGSLMLSMSRSSETIPSRRAFCAYTTISLTTCRGFSSCSKKTVAREPNAVSTMDSGNCSITAPRVPPKTMSAAVGWMICMIFPPSRVRPRIIPPAAMSTPAQLLLSRPRLISRLLFFCATRLRRTFQRGWIRFRRAEVGGNTRSDSPLGMNVKFVDQLEDIFERFAHNQFFACEQGDHGVWSIFDELNQIGVHDERPIVEASEMDH